MLILTVHFNLVKLCELDVVVGGAELLDLCYCAGSLPSELVAREIQNLKSLLVILFIYCLQILVLWSESAASGSIYWCLLYIRETLTQADSAAHH